MIWQLEIEAVYESINFRKTPPNDNVKPCGSGRVLTCGRSKRRRSLRPLARGVSQSPRAPPGHSLATAALLLHTYNLVITSFMHTA
jgi:hypothetical protein